ncbi:MAG: phenylalanine--tRNA ligase subunit beta, partial [Eubacteriales bacterium]|nr:phenylalanine--tRNA ligase subunit beta [Eubacteriales bacterium]
MKLPLKWLKDYVDYNVTHEEFANRMLLRGFEVAEIIPEMPGIKNVYVCTITGIEQHPNAERLRICDVDVGREEPLKIVTNATNVTVGCQVPVALDGAVLADGMEIKPTKMRGVMSYGMFCGGAELGITDAEYEGASNDSVLILNEQHENGQRIQEALDLDDVVFNIELTPNRPDCQSIIGICREAASALGQKFHEPVIEAITGEGDASDYASVTILNPELCPRYCARVVTDLKIEPSPRWMQQRLRLVGLRPINNIVDITNYIMMAYGQPLHCFDADMIKGQRIVVKTLPEGTPFVTLDGEEHKLSERDLAICNAEEPMCIAGVFGGKGSGTYEGTTNVVLESAYVHPTWIRKSARRHGLSTDASFRFERGIDPDGQIYALKQAAMLVKELAGGTISMEIKDVEAEGLAKAFPVNIRYAQVNELIGKEIPAATV